MFKCMVLHVAEKHSCFQCKSYEGELVRCNGPLCGKFYHMDCVSKQRTARIEGDTVICSLHACSTCASENAKNAQAFKGFTAVIL